MSGTSIAERPSVDSKSISIQHDGYIWISVGKSREDTSWKNREHLWSEHLPKLSQTIWTNETVQEYKRMSKSERTARKDVGGFVGGFIRGGRRKGDAVDSRYLLTLDADSVQSGIDIWALVQSRCRAAVAMYTTHSHTAQSPRVRIIAPLSRSVDLDEYQAISRRIAADIGIDFFDPVSFRPNQLMYWPSTPRDGEFIFRFQDEPWLDPDEVLKRYPDWRDPSFWPEPAREEQSRAKNAADKQKDPLTKPGAVGLFCKAYTVPAAIEKFLPDVYEPAGERRYTYIQGSSGAGVVLYNSATGEDSFAYSHHGTDPVGGQLVNAFDLVRIHRFRDMDDNAKPDTPANKLPSYLAMRDFAFEDPAVTALIDQEKYEQIERDFQDAEDTEDTETAASQEDGSWMGRLDRNKQTGAPNKSMRNVQIALKYDPRMKERIYKDTFAERLMGIAPLPWGARRNETGSFQWSDDDEDGLLVYLDNLLGIQGPRVIGSALRDHAAAHGRNPVEEYLMSLEWDGKPRLDTLYIDYFGADDHPYTRTVARKAFAAAVARALTSDAVKFDYMTVLNGPQGIGKSTLFRTLGKGWFTDSIKTFEGKEAEELIQGRWIVEIGELQAFNRTDINRVKQFLSKMDDQYRAAFGRHVKKQVRRCVFFGTTNDAEYLRDPSGNRRFWPVETLVQEPTKSAHTDLTGAEVDQIWAEAVIAWQLGEELYLSREMEAEAERRRAHHFETDPREGLIREFLEKPVPIDWGKRTISERKYSLSEEFGESEEDLVTRDRVCATEIWCECLGGDIRYMKRADAIAINTILSNTPGWKKCKEVTRFGPYGRVKGGFMRG